MRQTRRNAQHRGALVQGFAHQADIALGHVAHAAVQQFGRARGCALREIMGVDQHNRQAALRGVQSNAQSGRAAAHHGEVKCLPLPQMGQNF